MTRKNAKISHKLLKKRFQDWYKNHPDVNHEITLYQAHHYFHAVPIKNISPLWFVLNLMGDLVAWQETPTDWIEEIEKKNQRSNSPQKRV